MSFLLSNVSGVFLSAATVFNVLKTVGLVLLVILIVVVVLAFCVLFIPARYRAKGDIDQMVYDVRLHWFFKIIMFRASYRDGVVDYALHILGIRTKILDKDAMEKRKKRREKRKARKAARKYKSRKKKYKKEHDKYKEQYFKENQLEKENFRQSERNKEEKQVGSTSKAEEANDTESGKDKPTASKAIDVVKRVVHIIRTIMEHRPVQLLWNDILRFMYRGRPRRVKADIQFGFDDPALTGQVLGAISNLYFIYEYDQLYVNGDFEAKEAYIQGSFDIKGHIQAVFALIFVIRVMRKKQFKKFMNALKL